MICEHLPYTANQASVGCKPSRVIPGANSRTTNSKYSWSRPCLMSQFMMILTCMKLSFGRRLSAAFQDHDLGLLRQTTLGHFQNVVLLDAADAHFFQEFIDRVQFERTFV